MPITYVAMADGHARRASSVYDLSMVSKRQMATFTRSLGERIAQLRAQAGLTQEALAEQLDTVKSVVSRMETGRALPSLTRLVEIAEALDVDVLEFFAFDAPSDDERAERAATRAASLIRHGSAENAEFIARVVELLARKLRQ